MHDLKKKDTRTWELLNEGQFIVSKSDVPFTASGMDYGIEQENCALRVLADIKGIVNLHQAMEEYFLTADELGNMIKDFCETFGIEDKQNRKREDHYHLTGSKNTRTGDNDKKLSGIFNTYVVNFIHPNSMYNTHHESLTRHRINSFP